MTLRQQVVLTVVVAAMLVLGVIVTSTLIQASHPEPLHPYTNCVTETIVPIPSTGWAAAYLTCRQ